MRRYRENLRAHGFTFHELLRRIGGSRETLALILNDEVARGRVHRAAGRYSLNGVLDAETREGLLALSLPEPPATHPTSGDRAARLTEPAGLVASAIPDYVGHPTRLRLG
jgi:hypothetical protein